MLIISIPKGEIRDKLKPRTRENNPRVDQWNELVKKYQEGIPGTKTGEVWIFFEAGVRYEFTVEAGLAPVWTELNV